MTTRITVNGVEYPSVDAMPADVRRSYEQMLARFPQLAAGGGTQPSITTKDIGPFHISASVQKRIVVNDHTYDNEAAMPADVRHTYEQGMAAAQSNDPAVKRNEIKVTFQLGGPTLHLGANAIDASRATPDTTPVRSAAPQSVTGLVTSRPIEPAGLSWRFAWGVAVGVGFVLAWWLLFYR